MEVLYKVDTNVPNKGYSFTPNISLVTNKFVINHINLPNSWHRPEELLLTIKEFNEIEDKVNTQYLLIERISDNLYKVKGNVILHSYTKTNEKNFLCFIQRYNW